MNKLIDAYTVGFLAPQGHGKTYTMVKIINQHPETDTVVFSTEVNEDEMIRRFGLEPRANLRVIYNPKPSIDDIIAVSYQVMNSFIFIDYLQDTVKDGKF
jgi:ABC-type lipopolysaccharide export system ATPase subunit